VTHGHRTLVVVRHAKAEREATHDHERRLTQRGRGDAAAAAATVSAALSVAQRGKAVALVSSAVRAVETWQLIASRLPGGAQVGERVEDALYQADVGDVTDLLTSLDQDLEVALVVGHNPTLEDTVRALAAGGDGDALARLDGGLSTAAVAVLSYQGLWSDLAAGSCRLEAVEVGRG
jgi:phosphohistidine phosphatase